MRTDAPAQRQSSIVHRLAAIMTTNASPNCSDRVTMKARCVPSHGGFSATTRGPCATLPPACYGTAFWTVTRSNG
jgi:hypothetical protein